jgi:NCS1 family nucleobase:cation symporter-1
LSKKVFGFEGRWLWALLFGLIAVGLALLGPIGFVRRYVRKFAVWAVLASLVYLTWWVLDKSNLHAFWHAKGQGGLSLGSGIDVVIGSIISWTPLAADYTRFSRDRRSAFWEPESGTSYRRCGASDSACCSCCPGASVTPPMFPQRWPQAAPSAPSRCWR